MKTLISAIITVILFFSGLVRVIAQISEIDLGLLGKEKASIRFISVGSSLSAGVRDGGVYASAQQTSFPALLARQMGISNFEIPVLEGGGTGKFKTVISENGYIQLERIEGQFDDSNSLARLPKLDGRIDNLSIPFLNVTALANTENDLRQWNSTRAYKEFSHLNRFLNASNRGSTSYINFLGKQINDVDFFTYECGIQDFVDYYMGNSSEADIQYVTYDREGDFPEVDIWNILAKEQHKGLVLNVPEVYDLPYFSNLSYKKLKSSIGSDLYIERYEKNDVRMAKDDDLFLPNNYATQGLFDRTFEFGLNPKEPFPDEFVIGVEERRSVRRYNDLLASMASLNKLPLVDIYAIYKKIIDGEYVTDDEVYVDPSYPGGNFFSNDGIYPTAFGNAVIANECIKTINQYYKSQIPLLKTSQFLNLN